MHAPSEALLQVCSEPSRAMGDAWDDDDFEPVLPPAAPSSWEDEEDEEEAPGAVAPSPESIAARKAAEAKKKEDAASKRAAAVLAQQYANETPEERRMRERKQVEDADHDLADDLFAGAGDGPGAGESKPAPAAAAAASKGDLIPVRARPPPVVVGRSSARAARARRRRRSASERAVLAPLCESSGAHARRYLTTASLARRPVCRAHDGPPCLRLVDCAARWRPSCGAANVLFLLHPQMKLEGLKDHIALSIAIQDRLKQVMPSSEVVAIATVSPSLRRQAHRHPSPPLSEAGGDSAPPRSPCCASLCALSPSPA